jgi:hypothetical protein
VVLVLLKKVPLTQRAEWPYLTWPEQMHARELETRIVGFQALLANDRKALKRVLTRGRVRQLRELAASA